MQYETVEGTFPLIKNLPLGYLVEFGVFSGNTMNRIIKGAESVGYTFYEVYGFDSWIGLPEETPNVWCHPDWPKGAFNLCHDFNLSGQEEAMQFVRNRVERKDINLISGFFEESLTEELGKRLEDKASYMHIDVDIHKSTYQVLDFIFKYGIAKDKCLFRYDDWISTPEYYGGNSLAHEEIKQKYNLNFTRLATNIFQYDKAI